MNDPKPADCTCDYPRLRARNPSGHAPGCPAWDRWWKRHGTRTEAEDHLPSDEAQAQLNRIDGLLNANHVLADVWIGTNSTADRVEWVLRRLKMLEAAGKQRQTGVTDRLVGVLGVCPKCGGTRPTCCACPEANEPTHYIREGEPIRANDLKPIETSASFVIGPLPAPSPLIPPSGKYREPKPHG